jgi:hypothetical protein
MCAGTDLVAVQHALLRLLRHRCTYCGPCDNHSGPCSDNDDARDDGCCYDDCCPGDSSADVSSDVCSSLTGRRVHCAAE